MSRTRITADQALIEYMVLAGDRSLRELRRRLLKQGTAPSLKTLQTWCARHAWVARAQEHDSQIAEQARAQVLQHAVGERVALASAFSDMAQEALTAVLKALRKQSSTLVTKALSGSGRSNSAGRQ